jgi:mannose-6-phosphate isomerase-like protein (cupin superfamily)
VIGYPGYPHTDCIVNSKFDYVTWVKEHKKYSTIKIEGIEDIDQIRSMFNRFTIKNIHLFVSQRPGYSFNWHKDSVNVYLYVIKGRKTVLLKNSRVVLNPGQAMVIPRNHIHKVISKANTWALSIGY